MNRQQQQQQLRLELPPPAVGALSLSESLDRDYLLVDASTRRKRKRGRSRPREDEEDDDDDDERVPPSSSFPTAPASSLPRSAVLSLGRAGVTRQALARAQAALAASAATAAMSVLAKYEIRGGGGGGGRGSRALPLLPRPSLSPLLRGTVNSLVALDELGRGTATADGAAIAGAVLDSLALGTGCRGLFATHYHSLSAGDGAGGPLSPLSSPSSGLAVAKGGALPMHMSCRVDDDGSSDSVPRVTFLYKLVRGACPKSYGTNVARLAGLPEPVVARAAALAAELEEEGKGGGHGGGGGGGGVGCDASPSTPVPADLADLMKRAAAAAKGEGDLRGAVQAARAAVEGMV